MALFGDEWLMSDSIGVWKHFYSLKLQDCWLTDWIKRSNQWSGQLRIEQK
jgi:hypothetical protein